MSTYLDLANAQVSLDRDRENVEATARKLYTYCAALRERIRRYYGCMATAEKWAGLMEQAQKCAGLLPILTDFIEYMQNEEAQSNIDHVPERDRDLTAEEREGVRERIHKEEARLRRAAPDALVELRPLISQMEESLRYIGATKYLDLCRKMTAVLDAALRPVERGEEGAVTPRD